mmetsp:Transcript_11362/g.13765  ORF Transcript_11362/g.13765 Transcript_11362/m.13765 type:complete len:378 (-) Transcript_11362:1316-2449(-)|eukprot:CAMPEP_0184061572 /NCGR_PEP_ID=MMETSP0956-20121227/11585_1 /TAXON_ID=627963 /ORGANISM="Aplanochytrium sp, Strain PBS07" /LENGTH=377 /DNA_ID=CAMNT_0026358079 /DNA_START=65 /DNA_END=1198 /DNA_ORIENTATION=+
MYPGMSGGQYGLSSRAGSNVESLIRSMSSYFPQNKPRIVADVVALISKVRTLQPASDIHTSNSGISETLLKLQGTIPIRYQNNTYNIPVALWLPSAYPMQGPFVYVVPTNTMEVAHNHDHVAPDGTVFLPYLNQWNERRSNLVGLVDTCVSVFSRIPPVRSKAPPVANQRPPPAYSSGVANPYGNAKPPPPYAGYPGQQVVESAETRKAKEERQLRDGVKIKLTQCLKLFYQDIRVKVDKEFETQRLLKSNEAKLKGIERDLKQQQGELERIIRTISDKGIEVNSWLETNEENIQSTEEEDLNIDTVVTPADKWSEQLIDAVAEMNAIEDTLYYLDKALADDIIDLSIFLKEVRKLSRQQFMVKALAIKIMKKQQVQ